MESEGEGGDPVNITKTRLFKYLESLPPKTKNV